MLQTPSGSIIATKLCMHNISTQGLKGTIKVQQASEHHRLVSDDAFSVKSKRPWQSCKTIKQMIISHFKRNAFTCFQFSCFFQFLEKPCLGPHVSWPTRCCMYVCLPASLLPYCFMFAYLFAFTYSYLRFGCSFLASWYLSIRAWPQWAKSLLWSGSWR